MRSLDMDTSHGFYPGWAPGQTSPVYREAVWPGPQAVRARVTGGLGRLGALGFDWDIAQQWFQTGAQFTTDILRLRPPAGTFQQSAIDPRTGQLVVTTQPAYGYGGGYGPGGGFGGGGWLLPALLVGAVILIAGRSR